MISTASSVHQTPTMARLPATCLIAVIVSALFQGNAGYWGLCTLRQCGKCGSILHRSDLLQRDFVRTRAGYSCPAQHVANWTWCTAAAAKIRRLAAWRVGQGIDQGAGTAGTGCL